MGQITGIDAAILFLGLLGAGLSIATQFMKTMIPLRSIAIGSNIAFMAYGAINGHYLLVILHLILLPINIIRLKQMHDLVAKVKAAGAGGSGFNWLLPYMKRRKISAGEVIFSKGDQSDALFCVLAGQFRITEINKQCTPGDIVGELGMFSPNSERTMTLVADDDGEIAEIKYKKIKELYFQNPQFGWHLVNIVTSRLFDDVSRGKNVSIN